MFEVEGQVAAGTEGMVSGLQTKDFRNWKTGARWLTAK